MLTIAIVATSDRRREGQAELLILLVSIGGMVEVSVLVSMRVISDSLIFFLLLIRVLPVKCLVLELLSHSIGFIASFRQPRQLHEVLTLYNITVVKYLRFKELHGIFNAVFSILLS